MKRRISIKDKVRNKEVEKARKKITEETKTICLMKSNTNLKKGEIEKNEEYVNYGFSSYIDDHAQSKIKSVVLAEQGFREQ